ncbi:MAG: hypothetical protein K2N87_01845 [Eubacterium sp.]|nr:hypothetical protein [Eubacterium sp.]
MALAMLIFVRILANAAVEYDIRKSLDYEAFKNLKEIKVDETGKVTYKEDFVLEEGDIHFVILDESGRIIYGQYPKGCPQDVELNSKKLHQAVQGGEVFYIRDMRKHVKNGLCIYMRAIVCKSDTYSRYQTLEYLAYVSILAVFCFAIFCGVLLSRRISSSLKKMCQSAEKIGRSKNMSTRMEYDGKYYELSVLTQANNRMLDRLEETFRQQEQFTSDVAHELRTPVAVMTAQCQYAHGKSVSREDYQEAFEVIERQSAKIGEIISRLLELSRLDHDRRQIQKEEVDLPELVQSVCEDLQQKSGDSLNLRLELEQAHTVGDISLVMIAIQNLLTNAVRYSDPGSRIEVETGQREGKVFVCVKDHGAGIGEEDLPYIFKRFYKTDKSRNSQGFGLGLPLAMKIAQKHGGTILAESRLGEGSRFTLLLPDVQADAGLEQASANGNEKEKGNGRASKG